MLERLYTTKMSANKKTIENRFSKIRYQNNKIHKISATFMTVAVIITMLCANVVMAMVDGQDIEQYQIEVKKQGSTVQFTNKPFVENGVLYMPLRETIDKFGDTYLKSVSWNDGTIDVVLINEHHNAGGFYRIKMDEKVMRLKHLDLDNPDIYSTLENTEYFHTSNQLIMGIGMKALPILKDGVTYIPIEDINYMLYSFLNIRDENNKLYEIEYSIANKQETNTQINYIPMSTIDSKDAVTVLNSFLKALHKADYEKMTQLCTVDCVNNHFEFIDSPENASVYGIHRASVKSISYGYANKENDYTKEPIIVTLNCELPAYLSAIGGEKEIKVYFEKQPDGMFLISDFTN